MKLKLQLTKETKKKVIAELDEMGIEISEDSELILTEDTYQIGQLVCKDDTDTVLVDFDDICYIEALGREITVYTTGKAYRVSQRIYQLENQLPEEKFIRISNGIIIHRKSIKRIIPGLSSKFYLTLVNGDNVTVTRTYYYKFKEYFKI